VLEVPKSTTAIEKEQEFTELPDRGLRNNSPAFSIIFTMLSAILSWLLFRKAPASLPAITLCPPSRSNAQYLKVNQTHFKCDTGVGFAFEACQNATNYISEGYKAIRLKDRRLLSCS
jgi:hypothetical protein